MSLFNEKMDELISELEENCGEVCGSIARDMLLAAAILKLVKLIPNNLIDRGLTGDEFKERVLQEFLEDQ